MGNVAGKIDHLMERWERESSPLGKCSYALSYSV